MADLNLDGLPALQRTAHLAKEVRAGDSRLLMDEIRQLVEREVEAERVRGILMKAVTEQRLPAWAKPVMRAVCKEKSMLPPECWRAFTDLTEAQLKEIGEDDG